MLTLKVPLLNVKNINFIALVTFYQASFLLGLSYYDPSNNHQNYYFEKITT